MTVTGNKVTGSMAMGGSAKTFDIDAGGALFGDGPSAQVVFGTLPLAQDYAVTFRVFDVNRQKIALKQATVVAVEDVTVPAGTFKAFKIHVKSAEGDPGETTLWVGADTRRVVKVVATQPNGVSLTSELTK